MVSPSQAGRLRKFAGIIAEDRAAALNARCEERGIARLRRLFPECSGAPGVMRPIAKAEADFYGTMLDGTGRAVLVECKSCYHATLDFSVFEQGQLEGLEAVDKAKGVAVVLIVSTVDYVVPWWVISSLREKGYQRVRLEALAEFAVPVGRPYLLPFFRESGK